MSTGRIIRIAADIMMTVGLPVLMAYELVEQTVHEWIGTVETVQGSESLDNRVKY